ncbi:hypothetical protein [Streptomyces chryseus]
MPERTDHPQADEALRRAQGPDAATRRLLAQIIKRLTTVHPSGAIDDSRRLSLALRYATEAHGWDTPAANAAEQDLLRYMPRIHSDITRGEYALRLRKAGGLTAPGSVLTTDPKPRPGGVVREPATLAACARDYAEAADARAALADAARRRGNAS